MFNLQNARSFIYVIFIVLIKKVLNMSKKRLLIISCSERKKKGEGHAIDVYDGLAFRVLRKYLSETGKTENSILDVKIISAKYGLIDKDEWIKYYDEKMTPEKAIMYKKKYQEEIRTLIATYNDVLFFGGSVYQLVIDDKSIKRTNGRIGQQLSQLKHWLYSNS